MAGIVCPQCNASLEPTRLSNAIVLMIALAAGNGVGYYLRLRNVGTAGELLGLLGTMFVVWVLLLGIFIRLQIKQSSLTPWRR